MESIPSSIKANAKCSRELYLKWTGGFCIYDSTGTYQIPSKRRNTLMIDLDERKKSL